MEMEHINENLIKVLIGPEDLEERGIDFLDLIGDQSSIEQFFYSILEEVDVDRHFQGSEALTFQVMPNQDGLELYISRANLEDMDESWEDELTKHLLARKKQKANNDKKQSLDNPTKEADSTQMNQSKQLALLDQITKSIEHANFEAFIIRFEQLQDYINLAREIPYQEITSDLYHYNGQYYLIIKGFSENIREDFPYPKLLSLLEYGEKYRITIPFLTEHGRCIRANDAVYYFGNNF